jgi:hypothetical protein
MELDGKEGPRGVLDALYGMIVEISEGDAPFFREGALIYGVAMVLAGYEAAICVDFQARLIVTAMAVRQFVGCGSGGECHDLAAETNAKGRDTLGQSFAGNLDSLPIVRRVTRAVGDEHGVALFGAIVIVQGYALDLQWQLQ